MQVKCMSRIDRHPTRSHIDPMRKMLLIAVLVGAFPTVAPAASSDWLESDGGRVRLVTTGIPGADGLLNGALEIDLKPGWKTYWRDPGGSGVPPTVDVSTSPSIASATLSFPPPERFDDGYAKWAGYRHSIALPVKFTTKAAAHSETIRANIFLGICETICIPVQGQLVIDPASDPDNAADAATVRAAFAALPSPDKPDFGVSKVVHDQDRLVLEAALPADTGHVDLFLASDHGYAFGIPERRDEGGKIRFSVPILDQPATATAPTAFRYTLVTDAGSVDGTVSLP